MLKCNFIVALLIIFSQFSSKKCKCPEKKDEPINKKNKLSDHKNVTVIKQKRCCPYEFDSSLCKIIDDRILCGFNRNKESPKSNDEVKSYSNGCRLRRGRLECGYEQAPFTSFRRPPAWDVTDQKDYDSDEENKTMIERKESSENKIDDNEKSADDSKNEDDLNENEKVLRYFRRKNKNKNVKQKSKRNVNKCVEIEDRIVCGQY